MDTTQKSCIFRMDLWPSRDSNIQTKREFNIPIPITMVNYIPKKIMPKIFTRLNSIHMLCMLTCMKGNM